MEIKLKKLREIVRLESHKLKLKESWTSPTIDYAELASDMKSALSVLEDNSDEGSDITRIAHNRALQSLWAIADTLDNIAESSGR